MIDVIIIGGSFAGLSAAMALGRSLRSVLIIDSEDPCNKQAPFSHNFLTQDGTPPSEIAARAKSQVLKYSTVKLINGLVTTGVNGKDHFSVTLGSGERFQARKLLFATGLKDLLPNIEGFSACWGISVLHCPYCHGYEGKNKKIGLLGNGKEGFDFAQLISNWSNDLTLYTNGKSILTESQTEKLKKHKIDIVEKEIGYFEHTQGYIHKIIFEDKAQADLSALYARPGFEQKCDIPEKMGCELTDNGFIMVDSLQRTTVSGIYAAGDNISGFRSVSAAVSSGTIAGAIINKDLINETF